jgi:hypothetical protein
MLFEWMADGKRYTGGERLPAMNYEMHPKSNKMWLTDKAAHFMPHIVYCYKLALSRFPSLMNCFAVLMLGRSLNILKIDGPEIGRELWRRLPEEWKNDQEIAFLAWRKEFLPTKEGLPKCLDIDFFRKHIEQGCMSWKALPENLMKDIDFARSISRFYNCDLAWDVLRAIPALCQERAIWLKINVNAKTRAHSMRDLVAEFAPPEVRSDREVMLTACLQCSNILKCVNVDSALVTDREFVETILVHVHSRFPMFPNQHNEHSQNCSLKHSPSFDVLPTNPIHGTFALKVLWRTRSFLICGRIALL